jgi:hypothetical protein
MRPPTPSPENHTLSEQGKCFKNNVELGGIEPAGADFRFGWSETFPQVNNPFAIP